MPEKISFVDNKTQGEVLDILCVRCKTPTSHRVTASLDKDGHEENRAEGWSIYWADHYQIVQCQGCKSVSFRHQDWFSEAEDQYLGEDGKTVRLYPKRNTESLPKKQFTNVPPSLRRIYTEVIDCFNNDCLTLSAAGLRAVVEGICANQGVQDGPLTVPAADGGKKTVRRPTLEGKIFGLHEKGVLTELAANTLHEHRFLGNDAIHELLRPSTEVLRLAIEIVEHTLEGLYDVPEKALQLKRKTSNSEGGPS